MLHPCQLTDIERVGKLGDLQPELYLRTPMPQSLKGSPHTRFPNREIELPLLCVRGGTGKQTLLFLLLLLLLLLLHCLSICAGGSEPGWLAGNGTLEKLVAGSLPDPWVSSRLSNNGYQVTTARYTLQAYIFFLS